MIKGIEVVGAAHGGEWRAYTSHWVSQVSFEEPIVMASASPKHDTHPLMVAAGEFSVSILAGDQIVEGQYFSYPGHKLRRVATEYLTGWPGDPAGPPVVPNAVAWLRCATFRRHADGGPRAVLRPRRRRRAGPPARAAAAVLEPARLAGDRRPGAGARRQRP